MNALITPSDFTPKTVFSPSGLSRARRCLYSWGLQYLLGIKRPEWTWAEAQAAPVPKAKVKSRPTDEEREAKKAYNRLYRPALGKETHARAEAYYRGEDIEWNDKPGKVLLAGMHCLPHPDECAAVECEGEIMIEVDGVRFRGFRDLLVQTAKAFELPGGVQLLGLDAGEWLLVDYKTTFTFDFFDRDKTMRTVKSPEQLRADPQSNLYAYAAMRDKGLTQLRCRWLYLRTEGEPAAEPIDFVITWEGASAIVAERVTLALELTAHVGAVLGGLVDVATLLETLEKNPDACEGFGGCEYHADRAGPCTPPKLTPGEKLVRARAKDKARAALPPKPERPKRTHTMGFRNKPSTTAAAPKTVVEAPAAEAPEEHVEAIEAAGEEAEALAEELETIPVDEAPAAPAPAAPKAAKPKAAKEVVPSLGGEALTVSRGATLLEVPPSSPFYKPLLRALKAVEDCQKALAGE